MKNDTLCVHGGTLKCDTTRAVTPAIYTATTFSRSDVGQGCGYDYARLQNPTREHVENVVAKLEGGFASLAFSCGMAATTTLMELFDGGDEIVASEDLYGGTIRMFEKVLRRRGISIVYSDTSDLSDLSSKITRNTRAVFIETPTNPMMHVTDIQAVAQLIAGKNILLIVDNTFLTPYLMRPLELGADIVIHSGTKYLGGHNDCLAGFVVVKNAELEDKLRYFHKTSGAVLAPFDCYLVARGIKTLAIRMDRAQQNAAKVADWLRGQKKATRVFYPGFADHPEYEISKKQASGFGAMLSFETDTEETARNILRNVKLILFAESLGGTETLITYPTTQTHSDLPDAEKEARGITRRLLRVSVGIESAEDIISDLEQAMG
ncbi:MAG: PLP-dependent aspartate aminotransferase family protein [Oscillospiraceae bacterium]|jgi:cystathionine gamma-synthase|nr:PLP-dependent aspartate aminotransferase family protein [Oscillospiraceae bacterium]